MDKQGEARKLADELLADIEFGRIDATSAVLKATRLARLTNNDDGLTWLRYESQGYPADAPRDLLASCGRRAYNDEGKATYNYASLPLIESMINVQRDHIAGLRIDSISGDHVATALREHGNRLANAGTSLLRIKHIPNAVLTAIHEFASDAYYELIFSEIQADLFATARSDVDGRLAPLSGDVLRKIESINERLHAGDREAISQAMNTCRRMITSVADAIFPVRDEPYGDEQMSVKNDKVLNRFKAFMIEREASASRRDRLRRTIGDLFARVSSGVHDDVTPDEARFVFLHTYVTLGEILSLGEPVPLPETDS